jgi:hypothetical protein
VRHTAAIIETTNAYKFVGNTRKEEAAYVANV